MKKLYLVESDILAFLLAGKCEAIIESTKTKLSFGYKLIKCKQENTADIEKKYYVSVKVNDRYVYGGFITYNQANNTFDYCKGARGNYSATSTPIKALLWVLRKSQSNQSNLVNVYHIGKCACCGKKLTQEVDLKYGIGSQCKQKFICLPAFA